MWKRFTGMAIGLGAGLLLMWSGCIPVDGDAHKKVPVTPSSMFFERSHHFCSDHIEDRFLIGYYGDEVLDTTIHFFVISHTGDTIYRDSWPAADLLADRDGPELNTSGKVNWVKSRMRALVDGQESEGEGPSLQTLDPELDLGPVFRYQVNSNRSRSIAFSRSQKNVVVL